MNASTPAWLPHIAEGAPVHLNIVPRSLQSYLDEAADRFGDHKAVIFQNLTLNYRQLKEKAETFAAALREHGLNTGDRVAIMLPNLPQTIIAFWGALKAGATVVMTNPLYMEKELTHHFSDATPKFLITLDLFWNKIEPLRERLGVQTCVVSRIRRRAGLPAQHSAAHSGQTSGTSAEVRFNGQSVIPWKSMFKTRRRYSEEPEHPEDTLALLQYTGGTTGFSKGAMLTHGNLSAQIQQLLAVIHCDASNSSHSFLSIMPFFHVFGLMGNIVLPAVLAASTMPVPRYSPHDVLELIKKHRPTFFVGAPSVYISLMQQKDISHYDLTCIQLCISGSSPFPQASLKQFQDITHANITEGLGLTEASPVVIANPVYGLQKIGSSACPFRKPRSASSISKPAKQISATTNAANSSSAARRS